MDPHLENRKSTGRVLGKTVRFANSHFQFWDGEAPDPPQYFAAPIQMMQAAMSPDYAEFGPILVDPSS